MRPERGRLPNVDVLRAVAALSVLAIHAYALGGRAAPLHAEHVWDVPLISLASGVWLFFAISGFVICRPFVEGLLGLRELPGLGRYAVRRALRIYPMYWLVLTGVLVVDGSDVGRWWQYPVHFLLLNNLLPGRQEALFSAAWTLAVEVLFYACVPALAYALSRFTRRLSPERLAIAVMAIWAGSIAFTAVADLQGAGRIALWLRGSLPAMLQMFCPGILLAVAPHLRSPGWRRWLVDLPARRGAVVGAVGLIVAAALLSTEVPLGWGIDLYQLAGDASRPLFALGFGLILARAVRARPWERRWSLLSDLGLVSYGVYLIHPLVLSLLLTSTGRRLVPLPRDTLAAFVVHVAYVSVLVVPLAVLGWRVVEAPAIALAHRLGRTGDAWRSMAWGRWALAGVLALALALRLGAIAATPQFVPTTDAADYDRHAVSIADHGTFPPTVLAPNRGATAFRPPGFPVALAAVYAVAGTESPAHRWRAGRLFEALLGTLAVSLIALIAYRLWGRVGGLVAGALAAVYPPLIMVGSSLMSESLFIPLILGGVLAALMAREGGRHVHRWAALSGMLIGAGALTRSNGAVVLVAGCALVWTERPRRAWRSLRAPLVLVVAAALTVAPWTLRNAVALHAFVPISTQGGYALQGTYNDYSRRRRDYPTQWIPPVEALAAISAAHPHAGEPEVSARLRQMAVDFEQAHPPYFLAVAFWSTVRLFNLQGAGYERYVAPFEGYSAGLAELSVYAFWVLCSVALVGLAVTRCVRRQAMRAPAALWLAPLGILGSDALFSGATRYRSPADPFLILLGALTVVAWGRQWRVARSTSGASDGRG